MSCKLKAYNILHICNNFLNLNTMVPQQRGALNTTLVLCFHCVIKVVYLGYGSNAIIIEESVTLEGLIKG